MDRGELLLLVYLVACVGVAGYMVGQRVAASRASASALQGRVWELEARERERKQPRPAKEAAA